MPPISFPNGWEVDQKAPGCSYAAGIYQAISTGLDTCEYLGSDAFSPTDIAVRMQVSILSGQWAGLKIRSRQNNYYLFQINSNGMFRFARHDAKAQDDFSIPGQIYPVAFGQSRWTTLQIVARGCDFAAYCGKIERDILHKESGTISFTKGEKARNRRFSTI